MYFVSCLIWTWKMAFPRLMSPESTSLSHILCFLMHKWSISCSIRVYRYTAWFDGPIRVKVHFFHFQIKLQTKTVRISHFTASVSQMRLLWVVLKLSSFWTFLAKKKFSIDFLKIFSNFFSRKAPKSRKFFHEKNSSSLKKLLQIIQFFVRSRHYSLT